MTDNELVVGEPRLGWLADGNPDTPDVAVMLRNTGDVIELTVPLKGKGQGEELYERWWASEFTMYADDPDRTTYDYKPPRVLQFHDVYGTVVLVGCRSTSYSRTVGSSSNGKIVANYAVLGGRNLNYETINGMRTEIPALVKWTRLGTMKIERETDEQGRLQGLQMKLGAFDPIEIDDDRRVTLRSMWTADTRNGQFNAHEWITLQTEYDNEISWDDQLLTHGAILDLVSIAAWRPFGYANVEVNRADDPERALGGNVIDKRWAQVVTHRLLKHESWKKEPRFLFPYEEVGTKGVRRWLIMRNKYDQAFGPLLSILRSDSPWSESNVVQSGIALENLGYLIDSIKHDSTNQNQGSRKGYMSFNCALKLILDDMEIVPVADRERWIENANKAYMGLKHFNRPTPDTIDMLNVLKMNILVIRFWVALQLGVDPKTLKDNLELDPLANPFIAVD